MEWKWMCNICKKVVNNSQELMTHYFFDHQEAIHYGTPIATEKLPIPTKEPKKPKKPVTRPRKRKEELPAEEYEEEPVEESEEYDVLE